MSRGSLPAHILFIFHPTAGSRALWRENRWVLRKGFRRWSHASPRRWPGWLKDELWQLTLPCRVSYRKSWLMVLKAGVRAIADTFLPQPFSAALPLASSKSSHISSPPGHHPDLSHIPLLPRLLQKPLSWPPLFIPALPPSVPTSIWSPSILPSPSQDTAVAPSSHRRKPGFWQWPPPCGSYWLCLLIPLCSFSSSLADLLATSLDTLHVPPPPGFSFTIHSSWNLSLSEICRLAPLLLHVSSKCHLCLGGGGGLWSSHLKFPLPHTPYPPT